MLLGFGNPGVAKGQFGQISGIAIGTKGEIFISDLQNNCVQKFIKYKVTQRFDRNGTVINEEEVPVPAKEFPANLTKTATYDPESEAQPLYQVDSDASKNARKENNPKNSPDVQDKVKDIAVDEAKKVFGF
jgi:hypothetical protein